MPNLARTLIPLSRIDRIEVYINKSPRKTVAKIKQATGADYILNGTLYDMKTGEAVCHLKADGKLWCGPAYATRGYAWNGPGDFAMELLPNVPKTGDTSGKANFIACDQLIPTLNPYIGADRKGKRGRSAIGIKDGCLALYCSKDGSDAARTPEQLRDDLAADGWGSAIMLDGGGSSQCDFDGLTVTSSRKVQHLLLVYLKKEPQGDDSVVNVYSKEKDGSKKVVSTCKNFTVKEFACEDGSDPVFISPELVKLLQQVRDHFEAPVTITSGFRTASYNAKVKNASKHSQHLYGMAADIQVKGVTPKKVYDYVDSLLPYTGGVGLYNTFVHVDVRKTKSRWNG